MKGSKNLWFSLLIGLLSGLAFSQVTVTETNAHYGFVGLWIVGILFFAKIISDYKWRGLLSFLVVAILGVSVEYIGINTCIPYGCFEYSSLLGPRFHGSFPWVLLVIWPLISLSIAHLVSRKKSFGSRMMVGAGLLVLLDLFLDPVIVSQGFRSYAQGGWWRGVPWSNFLGWIPMGLLTMAVIFSLLTRKSDSDFYPGLALFFFGFYFSQFLFLL